ncbi:MAG: MBL fold metallo-hydrolase [Nitrososphaerota archaeon]|nr:MBL fold metallo-hydrolase [Nitrososphaerota archaeon]
MYATKVAERVYLLDTYALGVAGTVGAYLVKGPKPALVDCGYSSSYESVLAGLAEVGVMPSEVRYVIPTHVHLDHAGAAGRLLREMPNAEVVAHERALPHLEDPTRLIESSTMVFGRQIMELYGRPDPIPSGRMTAVREESRIDLGDGLTATLMHTPGHAPHQISVTLDNTGVLLTADAVGIVYPGLNALIPTTPPPSFNPSELVASVGRLRQMTPKTLLVPHFGARKDAEWVFGRTTELVSSWVTAVKEMWKQKSTLEKTSERMEETVATDAGVEELPIYAKVSVRTSVMGIMHYLDKNH